MKKNDDEVTLVAGGGVWNDESKVAVDNNKKNENNKGNIENVKENNKDNSNNTNINTHENNDNNNVNKKNLKHNKNKAIDSNFKRSQEEKFKKCREKISGYARQNEFNLAAFEKDGIMSITNANDTIKIISDDALGLLRDVSLRESIGISLGKLIFHIRDEIVNCKEPLSKLSPLSSELKRRQLRLKKNHESFKSATVKAEYLLNLLKLGSTQYRLKENKKVFNIINDNHDTSNEYVDELYTKIKEDTEKETELKIRLMIKIRDIKEAVSNLEGKVEEFLAKKEMDARTDGVIGLSEKDLDNLTNSDSKRKGWLALQRTKQHHHHETNSNSFYIPSHMKKYWPCWKHVAGCVVDTSTNVESTDEVISDIDDDAYLNDENENDYDSDKDNGDNFENNQSNSNINVRIFLNDNKHDDAKWIENKGKGADNQKFFGETPLKFAWENNAAAGEDDSELNGLNISEDVSSSKSVKDAGGSLKGVLSFSEDFSNTNFMDGLIKKDAKLDGLAQSLKKETSSTMQTSQALPLDPKINTTNTTTSAPLTAEAMRKILIEYYTIKDPKKVAKVDTILKSEKYKNNYQLLLDEMIAKYGDLESIKKEQAGGATTNEKSFTLIKGTGAASTPSPSQVATTPNSFFVGKNSQTSFGKTTPTSISPVTTTLFANSNSSTSSVRNSTLLGSKNSNTSTLLGNNSNSSSSSNGFSTNNNLGQTSQTSNFASPPTQTQTWGGAVAQQGKGNSITRDKMIEVLTAYYSKHDKMKLDKITEMLLKYKDHFDVLLQKLQKKYGPVPSSSPSMGGFPNSSMSNSIGGTMMSNSTGGGMMSSNIGGGMLSSNIGVGMMGSNSGGGMSSSIGSGMMSSNTGVGWTAAGASHWASTGNTGSIGDTTSAGAMNIMKTGSAPLQNYSLQQGNGPMTGQVTPFSSSPSSLFNRGGSTSISSFQQPSTFINPNPIGSASSFSTFNKPAGTSSPFQSQQGTSSSWGLSGNTSPYPAGRTSPINSSFISQSPAVTPFTNNASMISSSPFTSSNGTSTPLASPFLTSTMGQSSLSNQPSLFSTQQGGHQSPFGQQGSQQSPFGQTIFNRTSPGALSQPLTSSVGMGQSSFPGQSGNSSFNNSSFNHTGHQSPFNQASSTQSSGSVFFQQTSSFNQPSNFTSGVTSPFGQQSRMIQPINQSSTFGRTSPIGQENRNQAPQSTFGQSSFGNRSVLGPSSRINQTGNAWRR